MKRGCEPSLKMLAVRREDDDTIARWMLMPIMAICWLAIGMVELQHLLNDIYPSVAVMQLLGHPTTVASDLMKIRAL